MNICEPFRQTAGDIAKICDANFHHRLVLNIGVAIPWYLCMFLSFSCEWRSSVVQARMCKLGRDPLIFLKILVVIGHVCIYWSKVAEGFSVFNAVLSLLTIALWRNKLLTLVVIYLWCPSRVSDLNNLLDSPLCDIMDGICIHCHEFFTWLYIRQ